MVFFEGEPRSNEYGRWSDKDTITRDSCNMLTWTTQHATPTNIETRHDVPAYRHQASAEQKKIIATDKSCTVIHMFLSADAKRYTASCDCKMGKCVLHIQPHIRQSSWSLTVGSTTGDSGGAIINILLPVRIGRKAGSHITYMRIFRCPFCI